MCKSVNILVFRSYQCCSGAINCNVASIEPNTTRFRRVEFEVFIHLIKISYIYSFLKIMNTSFTIFIASIVPKEIIDVPRLLSFPYFDKLSSFRADLILEGKKLRNCRQEKLVRGIEA